MQVQRWIFLLLGRWGVLLLGAFVGGLFGAVAAIRTPAMYESASTVVLSPMAEPSGLFGPAGVRNMLGSATLRAQVAADLDAMTQGADRGGFGAGSLVVEDVPTTQLFMIKVRLTNPELAARVANAAAQRAVESMARAWQESVNERRTQLETQMQRARASMQDSEDRLTKHLERTGSRRSPEGEELETEVAVWRKVYIDAAARHEQARLDLATKTPLRVVDPAVPAAQPLPGGRKRTVALGVLAGLLVAASFVIAREWQTAAPPAHPPALV